MLPCYFTILGLGVYLHFVVCLNASTSALPLYHKENRGSLGLGCSASFPPAVPSVLSSPNYDSTSSIHNDENRNGTQSGSADSNSGGAGVDGAISLPFRIANGTIQKDPPTISEGDGSQEHEPNRGTSTIQNCPEEPHICSHDDCGGNNGNFRCATQNPLHSLCQCCPDKPPECTNERCAASSPTVWMHQVTSPSQWMGRCESELLKGCSCNKEPLYDESTFADVDFCPGSDDEIYDGPGTEGYAEAVRNVVEMFGGIEKVPGYLPPAKDFTGS